MIDVLLLGCGGNLPTPDRSLTALLLNIKGRKILIDCGEGTQISMKMVGTGFKSIDIICITHFHGDHVIGLPGLLLTIANSGRQQPLTIIGPLGLKDVILGLSVLFPILPYEIDLIETDENGEVFNFEDFIIYTNSLDHTTSCNGYSFYIKRKRRFDPIKATKNKVPKTLWSKLQNEKEVFFNGICYSNEMVLGEERKGIKICYATDTRPCTNLQILSKDSDLFICEGMYGEDSYLEKALSNKHMLFSEAAHLAKSANVKELWLTHFSPSMINPEEYLYIAKDIFNNTILGEDRIKKTLHFED